MYGHAQVQQPVAGLVAGLDQLGPGVVLHDAVGEEQALLLERADGALGVGTEEAVGPLVAQEVAQGGKAGLDIDHLFACIASANGTHRPRLSERSRAATAAVPVPPGMTSASPAREARLLYSLAWPARTHPRRRRIVDRRLKIVAVVLWVVALALVAVYATQRSHAGAVGRGAPSDAPVAAASSTALHRRLARHGASTTCRPLRQPPPPSRPPPSPPLPRPPRPPRRRASLTVAAGGDVQGDRTGGQVHRRAWRRGRTGQSVKPYLQTADLAFVNLEGPVSDKGTKLRVEGVHLPQPPRPRLGPRVRRRRRGQHGQQPRRRLRAGRPARHYRPARQGRHRARRGRKGPIGGPHAGDPRHARGQGGRARLHRQVRRRVRGRAPAIRAWPPSATAARSWRPSRRPRRRPTTSS